MSLARQQKLIYIHGDKVIGSPVHGGIIPPHGSPNTPVGPSQTGPVHGDPNLDSGTSVALFTTNGVKKHSNIVLSNGNLTEAGSGADGAYQMIAADTSKTGKRQFEMTIDTVANNKHGLGIYDGVSSLSADITTPGTSVNPSVVLTLNGAGTFQIYKNGVNTGGGALTMSLADVFTCEYDTVANTVTFYKNSVQVDITQTAAGLSGWASVIAFMGAGVNGQNTVNFGGSAFNHALNSGYLAYQS